MTILLFSQLNYLLCLKPSISPWQPGGFTEKGWRKVWQSESWSFYCAWWSVCWVIIILQASAGWIHCIMRPWSWAAWDRWWKSKQFPVSGFLPFMLCSAGLSSLPISDSSWHRPFTGSFTGCILKQVMADNIDGARPAFMSVADWFYSMMLLFNQDNITTICLI